MLPTSPTGRKGTDKLSNADRAKKRKLVTRHDSHAKRQAGKRDAKRAAASAINATSSADDRPKALAGDFIEVPPTRRSKEFGSFGDRFPQLAERLAEL